MFFSYYSKSIKTYTFKILSFFTIQNKSVLKKERKNKA